MYKSIPKILFDLFLNEKQLVKINGWLKELIKALHLLRNILTSGQKNLTYTGSCTGINVIFRTPYFGYNHQIKPLDKH